MFLDAGIQPLHENCMNHGGMSWQHALELLDKCPGLKWLFDPANPIFNPDRSQAETVAETGPVGILDARPRPRGAHPHQGRDLECGEKRRGLQLAGRRATDASATFCKDAFARGYDAGISIETHMVSVFHDAKIQSTDESAMQKNFVEYGRRLEKMIAELKTELMRR